MPIILWVIYSVKYHNIYFVRYNTRDASVVIYIMYVYIQKRCSKLIFQNAYKKF